MYRTLTIFFLSVALVRGASFSGSMRLGGSIEFTLNAAAIQGTNQISLSSAVPWGMVGRGWLVVEPFHTNCEIVKVASVSGTLVTLTASTLYGHTNGTLVFWHDGDSFPPAWFGAVGNGSDDDHMALQRAIMFGVMHGLVVAGRNQSYGITKPIIGPNGHKLDRVNFKVLSGYAPNGTNNFIYQNSQGNYPTFTAATDDVFTTPTAHGIPADDILVVFFGDGSTVPTGITEGEVYYARDRTTYTFKVAATPGGAAVDLTSTGAGRVWCEVRSMSKTYLSDVLFDGSGIASNGFFGYLQQPAQWDKVRVNNVGGDAGIFKGQQAMIYNPQVYGCGNGIVFEDASFFYMTGLNVENYTVAGINTRSPGLISSHITGSHFEDAGSNVVAVVMGTNGFLNSSMVDVSLSGFDVNTRSNLLGFDMNGGGYVLQNVRFPQATPDAPEALALRDRSLNKLIYTWRDFTNSCNGQIAMFVGGKAPTSYVYSGEYSGVTIAANDGKEVRSGMGNFNQPVMDVSPGTNQTAPTVIFRNGAGLPVLVIGTDGVLYFTNQSGGARVFWNGTNAGW
jgi:hypothetical protein